jgi:hypothetical protein
MKVRIGIRRESSILKVAFYSNRSLTFEMKVRKGISKLRGMRSLLNSW